MQHVTDLVATLTAGKTTQYDRVRAIYDYFSPENGFPYSLSTPGGTSGTAIVDFLTSRRVLCAVRGRDGLARAGGRLPGPGRVRLHPRRRRQQRRLHADQPQPARLDRGVLPDFGWVPFDATPAGFVSGSVQSAWAPDPPTPARPATTPRWTWTTPPPAASGQPTIGPGGAAGGDDAPGAGPAPVNTWLLIAAAAVTALFILLFAARDAPPVRCAGDAAPAVARSSSSAMAGRRPGLTRRARPRPGRSRRRPPRRPRRVGRADRHDDRLRRPGRRRRRRRARPPNGWPACPTSTRPRPHRRRCWPAPRSGPATPGPRCARTGSTRRSRPPGPRSPGGPPAAADCRRPHPALGAPALAARLDRLAEPDRPPGGPDPRRPGLGQPSPPAHPQPHRIADDCRTQICGPRRSADVTAASTAAGGARQWRRS